MSSQFSYELDERQIRIMMQSAEVNFNESAWQRFDALEVKAVSNSSKVVKFIPNINFNFSVSRSIIVPIIFIGLIGGLSVLLFSFVDFKKKEEVIKETPLIATPPKEQKADPKPLVASKPKVNNPVPVNKTNNTPSVLNQPANNQVATTVIKKQETAKPIDTKTIATAVPEIKHEETAKVNEGKSKETVVSSVIIKKSASAPVTKKKRKRRMTSDELPSINTTPATLTSSSNEPELEIK